LAKIERGDLLNDDRQVAAMNALSNVQNVLIKGGGGGVVASSPSSGNDDQGGPTKLVKGAFIYGSVGTGKSMLMDEFFSTLPSTIENKKRVHFHSFMNEVHQRIHKFKKADIDKHGRSFHIDVDAAKKEDGRNAVYQVGLEFAREANVLCFDEFQVTDIADASILSQLLSTMVRNGVVMVSTSNRSPQELYLGGINREVSVFGLLVQPFFGGGLACYENVPLLKLLRLPSPVLLTLLTPLTHFAHSTSCCCFTSSLTHDGVVFPSVHRDD